MPLYDYKCSEHGYFELQQSMKDHARALCPTCSSDCSQVLLGAPTIDVWAMAKANFPGAHELVGNRMEKRHKAAGQDHHYWRDDLP